MIVIDIKRLISRGLFGCELIVFVWVYLFGAHGFHHLVHLRTECEQARQDLRYKQQEVSDLQEQIISWNVHSFYKEKMAREQLQMARKGELIYYLS